MTIRALRFAVVGVVLVACEPRGEGVIAVEANDLGITELEVRHERVQDDRLLTLRGFDRDGTVIATAVLRTGMVLYGADVPEDLHAGTELKVTIGEQNESFVSPDRVPHVIYEPLSPGLGTFVTLHAVANEIAREAGIRFAPPVPAPSDEISYTGAACSGSRFPTNKGGANQCCQDNANTYHVNPSTLQVANRSTYAPAYPSIPVCRDSAGNTGCTTNCMYGPCGSAVLSLKGTNGHVFHPTSNPNVCGWDDGGAGGLGVDYSPEHYTNQTLYGAMTASCLCTGCNTDGTPVCGANLCLNPTFETNLTSWDSFQATLTRVSSPTAHGGSFSCNVCSSGGSNYTLDDLNNTIVGPAVGSVYMVTAWVRSSTGTPTVRAVLREDGGNEIVSQGASVTVGSTWQKITAIHTVSSDAFALDFFFEVPNGGSGTCFLIDDVNLFQVDTGGGGGGGGCTPETDPQFCSRLGKNCGQVRATDNCGVVRTVSSCGTCTLPQTCGGGGTPNVCGGGGGGGTNLLPNPTFETNLNNWSTFHATLTRVSSPTAHGGTWSCNVCESSGSSNYTIDDQPNTVSSPASGSVYVGTAWVRSTTGTPSVRAVLRESGGGALRTDGPSVTVGTTWQQISVTHTVSSGVSALGVFYEVQNGGSGTCFLIDDASLILQ